MEHIHWNIKDYAEIQGQFEDHLSTDRFKDHGRIAAATVCRQLKFGFRIPDQGYFHSGSLNTLSSMGMH